MNTSKLLSSKVCILFQFLYAVTVTNSVITPEISLLLLLLSCSWTTNEFIYGVVLLKKSPSYVIIITRSNISTLASCKSKEALRDNSSNQVNFLLGCSRVFLYVQMWTNSWHYFCMNNQWLHPVCKSFCNVSTFNRKHWTQNGKTLKTHTKISKT